MKNSNQVKPPFPWIVALLALIVGGSLGWVLTYYIHGHDISSGSQERSGKKYNFINPLLECNVASGTIDSGKQNFSRKLSNFIDDKKAEGTAKDVAVLFRDLNNGPTFGINESEDFIPASLLKVPVMMAYFSWAEEDSSVLKNKILFKEEYRLPDQGLQLIASKQPLEVGKEYEVMDLIEKSIIYSDNQAVTLLVQNIDQQRIDDVFDSLGVNVDVIRTERGKLTVKEYGAFFRVLFNASYLNRTYSEKALEILSRSAFDDGIVSGVSEGVVVAHKFGESGELGGLHQLHDCGIVYYPKHPYLLCVMTSGEKTVGLEDVIEDISQFVFEEIARQYPLD